MSRLKAESKSGSISGLGAGALGGLVQGAQEVTALEEVQVPLQRDVDLAVVTSQLRQEGGLEWRSQQTACYAWKETTETVNV